MRDTYTIYKARVTKVSIPDNSAGTHRKIYISPLPHDGTGPWERQANPPNFLPTSALGSGVVSYPSPGQECIVGECNGERQILSYIQPHGQSAYGNLIPERLEEGSVMLSVNGLKTSSLRMNKYGYAALFSNAFAQMSVDGTKQEVLMKGKTAKIEYAGGFLHQLYDKETKNTASLQVFTRKKDNPGFSDLDRRIEEGYGAPLPLFQTPYRYVDKAIIKAGHIEDESHLYEIQTRQNVRAAEGQDKNVITELKIGYQTAHERFGGQNWPEGSILEWSAKKNLENSNGLFKIRYGKLLQDTPGSTDRGELLRTQIYEDVPKMGTRIVDPMAEGKNWGLNYQKNADQVYISSFGRLLSSGSMKNSVQREVVADNKQKLALRRILGGEAVFEEQISQNNDLSLLRKLGGDKIYETTLKEGETL